MYLCFFLLLFLCWVFITQYLSCAISVHAILGKLNTIHKIILKYGEFNTFVVLVAF